MPSSLSMDHQPAARTFANPSLPSRVLHHLYEQASSGLHTDTLIHAGGTPFACHRAILSASSPVFSAMFSAPMRERTAPDVHLHDVDADVFAALRAYMYGRPLVVSDAHAVALSAFVRRYEIAAPELLDFLDALLTSALTLDNVLAVRHHAEAHSAHRLRRNCDRFITANVKALAKSPSFLHADVEVAVAMLQAPASVSRNSMSRICAQHVLAAALAWVAHGGEEREQYREKVLAAVDVEGLSLSALVRASRDPAAVESTQFQARLLRAFAQRAEQDLHFGPLTTYAHRDRRPSNCEEGGKEQDENGGQRGRGIAGMASLHSSSVGPVYHAGWGSIGASSRVTSSSSSQRRLRLDWRQHHSRSPWLSKLDADDT